MTQAILANIFLGLALFTIIATIFMLFRNKWVFNQRIATLNTDMKEYGKLAEYNTMLFKFWIWDIEKFKENK